MPTETLSPAEARDLKCLAGMIIPASTAYSVPGADDDLIMADMLQSLGRDFADVRTALANLARLAGGSFASLDPDRRGAVVGDFRAEGGQPLAILTRLVLLCYYRDDRVMRSLNLEPRPPFPKGHVVEQGDWSLLDQVRTRPRFWRDAP